MGSKTFHAQSLIVVFRSKWSKEDFLLENQEIEFLYILTILSFKLQLENMQNSSIKMKHIEEKIDYIINKVNQICKEQNNG